MGMHTITTVFTLPVAGDAAVLYALEVVQHLSRQLDIVVRKLANLGVVNAQNLRLLAGAEGQAWDEVHDEEDETGSKEGVRGSGDGVSQLVAQLDVVLVQETSFDLGEPIQMRYVIRGEECGQDVADETANAVNGKDVKSVVDAEEELELGRVVCACTAEDAKDDGGPCWDEAGTGSDADETGNDTGAESNGGPFALETVVKHTPGDASHACGNVGHHGCHDGPQVGSER